MNLGSSRWWHLLPAGQRIGGAPISVIISGANPAEAGRGNKRAVKAVLVGEGYCNFLALVAR